MQYDLIQGQGNKPLKVGNSAIFDSYLLRHVQWELATDQLGLVFVSHYFKVGTNVSCKELTVSPRTR